MYHFPYRQYEPELTMRWTMRDPLCMVDGPNVYAYVGGRVTRREDPLGLRQLSAQELCEITCSVPASVLGCWWCMMLPPVANALCLLACGLTATLGCKRLCDPDPPASCPPPPPRGRDPVSPYGNPYPVPHV